MKKTKIWIWIIIIVAIVIGVFFFLNLNKKNTVNYKTIKIDRGDIISMISATGTVEAITSVNVGSQVSGILKNVYVDYNSMVKKGQVIAQIDPVSFKAKLDQADASLTKAKISVADAKRTLDRDIELLSQNFIAQSEKDAAETAYETALANLKQAQASYNMSLADYRNTTIVSPITGIVISRSVDAGQTVAASFSAPTLFIIAKDLRQMQVEANVDEGDIGQVKEGQEVIFTVDAFPEKNFSGKVSQIRLSPQTIQRVVTYSVMIDVFNKDLLLKPGMTATVNMVMARANNVLRVTNAAFKFRPSTVKKVETNKKTSGNTLTQKSFSSRGRMDLSQVPANTMTFSVLWVLDGEKLKPIKVQTGVTDGIYTEIITNELSENHEVITGTNSLVNKAAAAVQSSPFGMGAGRRTGH